jgi:hypothetical protein
MWRIKSTKIIDSELEAIKIISEISCINAGEKIEITDFNGKVYNLTKPLVKKYQLTTNKKVIDFSAWWNDKSKGYSDLDKDDIINLAEYIDFEIWCLENRYKKRYFLVDLQGGNLGGIESEVFCNLHQVIERLETYLIDYFKEEY